MTTRRGGVCTGEDVTGAFCTGAGVGAGAGACDTAGGAATVGAGRCGACGATLTAGRAGGLGGTGTVCRGSGDEEGVTILGACGTVPCGGATAFAGGRFEAGATVTDGRGAGGGVERATASACLRSKIALSASPGFETCDRLNSWRASAGGRAPLPERLPRFT